MHAEQDHDRARIRTARAEASAWIVRLHGPHRDAELEAGFRAWLAANPENARQFERVTEVWNVGAIRVPGIPRLAPERAAADSRHRRNWSLAAVITAISVAAGGWALSDLWLQPAYTTEIGEQRVVPLSDGSRLTLNANSRVEVKYTESERRVVVERGEAFFQVAKNAKRPFRVFAGDSVVEAIGTSFVVRREAQQLTVTLVEGKIAVLPAADVPERSDMPATASSDTKEKRVTLQAGQRLQLALTAPDQAPRIDTPRMDVVTAWRRGEVMLDKTVLADAVAEMNRYDPRRIVIEDPRLAAIKVSGIYHTGDNLLFGQMVARLYGLELEERDGELRMRPLEVDSK